MMRLLRLALRDPRDFAAMLGATLLIAIITIVALSWEVPHACC